MFHLVLFLAPQTTVPNSQKPPGHIAYCLGDLQQLIEAFKLTFFPCKIPSAQVIADGSRLLSRWFKTMLF